jgi:hypothetical protein
MPLLPRGRTLQTGQLPRSEALQRSVAPSLADNSRSRPVILTYSQRIHPHRTAMLLEKEPNNIQAQSLRQLIEAAVAKGA